jgi:hypothetical protein
MEGERESRSCITKHLSAGCAEFPVLFGPFSVEISLRSPMCTKSGEDDLRHAPQSQAHCYQQRPD